MCLITKQMTPYITNRDITVCKVLVPDGSTLKTPYYGSPIEKIPILVKGMGRSSISTMDIRSGERVIKGGYIHSFNDLYPVKNEIRSMLMNGISRVCIVEAIIPKGSKYFIGTDCDVCSDKLFLNKIICNFYRSDLKLPSFIKDNLKTNKLNKFGYKLTPLELYDNIIKTPKLVDISHIQNTDCKLLCALGYNMIDVEILKDLCTDEFKEISKEIYKAKEMCIDETKGVDLILTTLMINGIEYHNVPLRYI